VVSFDEFRCDPSQLGGREGCEEVPGEVEGLFDRASPLTLADEALFESRGTPYSVSNLSDVLAPPNLTTVFMAAVPCSLKTPAMKAILHI
jgi:hypothetical protein